MEEPIAETIGTPTTLTEDKRDLVGFWVGVGLSVSSSLFIGVSFIIKKKALLRLRRGGKRANQGSYGYLKDFMWWAGFLSMGLGEALNFVAYAFAPASVVSTLGVLSVLVSTILSSKYLKEKLNILGKIGCFLCAVGSTVIVLHAPTEKDISSMRDLQIKISNPLVIIYVNIVVAISLILIYFFRIKYAETSFRTLLIWLSVCSMIGSLSVMSCKGLGLAITNTVSGVRNELTNWLTYFCLFTLLLCVAVQMNFLNKALDTFNTAVVTPIYYVMFTTCVIIASAILFHEFAYLSLPDWIGLIAGFLTVLTAIFILNFCKNNDFTLDSIARNINFVQIVEVKTDAESSSSSDDDELTIMKSARNSASVTSYGTQTDEENVRD